MGGIARFDCEACRSADQKPFLSPYWLNDIVIKNASFPCVTPLSRFDPSTKDLVKRLPPLWRNACLALSLILTSFSAPSAEDAGVSGTAEVGTHPLNQPAAPIRSRGGYLGGAAADAASVLAPPARLQVGDVALRPRLGLSLVYDDNIAADEEDLENDNSIVGNPGLIGAPGRGTILKLQAWRTIGVTIIDSEDQRTTTFGSVTLSHRLQLGGRSAVTSSLS